MPQVPQNFGPLYQQVVLNGSGIGFVTFQAVGNNVRLSNIFFKVSTSTNQAACTIYKGQIADGNIIFNSNSGSTGGNAKGNVDLFDGETVFVRWTGGDAGATATATFTGVTIPFGERLTPTNLTFDDPIAAGDGSLIYPALKSPNYVAGVSGWSINRIGSAEFNNVTVRGTVFVTGTSNSNVQIFSNSGVPEIDFQPPDQVGMIFSPASINCASALTGTSLNIRGANENSPANVTAGALFLGADNTIPGSTAAIVADQITLSGKVIYNPYTTDSGRGFVNSGGSNSSSGAIGATETTIFGITSFTYKANRAYRVESSGRFTTSGTPSTPSFRVRKDNGTSPPTGTQLVIGSMSTGTAANHSVLCNGVFTVGGSDVTTGLVFTGLGNNGFTVTTNGSPALTVSIYDIGAAADHALDPVLT